MSASELLCGTGWKAVASDPASRPIVAVRSADRGSHWVFGHDLAESALLLCSTTQNGINHRTYDRDTACGLERLFRLVANVCAYRVEREPAERPRLRAEIATDRQTYEPGDPVRVAVRVRDAEGRPCDAAVRIGFSATSGAIPERWMPAQRKSAGLYLAEARVPVETSDGGLVPAAQPANGYRQQRMLTVFADAAAPERTGDWTAQTVRVGDLSDQTRRMDQLAYLVQQGFVGLDFSIEDREQLVEVAGRLRFSPDIRRGRPAEFELTIDQVESDTGNDWMEEVALVLNPASDGEPVFIPVAAGKFLAAPKASIVQREPEKCLIVDGTHPAVFKLVWPHPMPGVWSLALRYRYSDDWKIKNIDRIQREDAIPQGSFEVQPVGDGRVPIPSGLSGWKAGLTDQGVGYPDENPACGQYAGKTPRSALGSNHFGGIHIQRIQSRPMAGR